MSANKDTNGFRTAINGYNRQDVNRFIEETSRRHSEEMQEARRQLQELHEQNDALSQQTDAEESAAIIGALNETCDRLLEDKSRLEAEISALQAEIAQLKDQLAQLPAQANAAENSDDALSRQAVEILLDARTMADRITGDARTQGQKILEDSRARADRQSAAVDHLLGKMSADCMTEYMVYLDGLRQKTDALLSEAAGNAQIMQKRLDDIAARTKDEIFREIHTPESSQS